MIDIIPYRADKNLGRAYNDAFRNLSKASVLCIRDYDTLWLTHDYNRHLDAYHERYPGAVLTCLTNRVSPLSVPQLMYGKPVPGADMVYHLKQAEKLVRTHLDTDRYPVKEIQQDISGLVMVIPRSVWEAHPFSEENLCLGVDTEWNRRIRAAGVKILLMQGVYVWHTYRLLTGIHDKRHLK